MEKSELRTIFESPFDLQKWHEVMHSLFKVKTIHQQPIQITLTANDLAYNAYELGNTLTSDERLIGFYQVMLKPKAWIEINRVSLRDLLRNVYNHDVDGALIVFIQDKKWRFSYVSQIRELNEYGDIIQTETEPKRYTYLMGEGEVCRTAADRFNLLNGNPISLEDIKEAFSVEKLNKEFFKKYKEFHEEFSEYLAYDANGYRGLFIDKQESEPEKQEKPIRDFVKILLGRIVFLQFLQKKGWMGVPLIADKWEGGDSHFVQNLFKNYSDKHHFHSKALKVLFFETLNCKRDNQIAPIELGGNIRIPYLNGGLFDRDISYRHSIDFPSDYFSRLLDFFEQYNFTIDENSPDDQEVGIDPEMLGHIFENLLEENREKGTFYTPKEIVHYMCQESLLQYLKTKISGDNENYKQLENLVRKGIISERDNPDNFIIKNARLIEDKLDSVKICDPAIGSGAFPMGLLLEIIKIKSILNPNINRATAKKDIIQNSIYGVDLDIGAVEIARLRFWLSLVVDESEPQPLPSLDYKIMQGNSVLERFEGIDLKFSKSKFVTKVVKEVDLFGNVINPQYSITEYLQTQQEIQEFDITELEEKFFNSDNADEKLAIKKKIEAFEKRFIDEQLQNRIDDFELQKFLKQKDIEELQNTLQNSGAGNTNATRTKYQKALSSLERKRKENELIQQEIDRLLERKQFVRQLSSVKKPWFLWHLYFMDVFDQGGFDIVIGNPPFVEHKKLKEIAYQLKPVYEVYTGSTDLSAYFFELGFNHLKTNGIFTYISTNKYFNTGWGKALRRYLLSKNIISLVNFEQVEVFEDVLVSSVIVLAKNSQIKDKFSYSQFYQEKDWKIDFREKILSKAKLFDQSAFDDSEWSFANNSDLIIKVEIEKLGIEIKNITSIEIKRGVTTGYDPAFIIDPQTNEFLSNYNFCKPVLKGREIKKYKSVSYQNKLLFIPWHFPLHSDMTISGASAKAELELKSKFPELYKHLELHKIQLSSRNVEETGIRYEWYSLQRCAASYYELFDENKIIWPLTADKWGFTLDYKKHYLTSGAFFLVSREIPLKYILAMLNSRLMQFYFRFKGVMTAGGAYTLKKATIEEFPLVILNDYSKFEILSDFLLFLHDSKNPKVNQFSENENIAQAFEDVLNMMVYELYFDQHVRDQELDVLKFIDTGNIFKDLNDFSSETEKAEIINSAYNWLQEHENPIRNRIILSNIKSKEIIRRINSVTN